jgi:hypothetical protein
MPARASTLDAEVVKLRANVDHAWETFTVEGAAQEYCARCGRKKAECRNSDEPTKFLPCKGFVG